MSECRRARSRCGALRGRACRTACRGRRCSRCTRASTGSSRRRGRIRRSPSSGGLATAPTSSQSATSRCSHWGGFPKAPKVVSGPSAWQSGSTPISTARGRRTARLRAHSKDRERDQVRRDDRHGRDPLGRGASTDRLDCRRRRDRPRRCALRARSTLSPHLRADHGQGVRALGRNLAELGGRRIRLARRIAAAGQIAARRRVAARRR